MKIGPHSRGWWLALPLALGLLGWSFASDFTGPWTEKLDFNGACWSQSAHNTLRAGVVATAGVPSAFYFGSPPIPERGFYTHHPPLLSLLLAADFAVLGESEWSARLLPVIFSFAGLLLLWWLVQMNAGGRTAAFSVLTLASMPMELRYGRMVNFEPITLVWMLALMMAWQRWEMACQRGAGEDAESRWWWLIITMAFLCLWTAWLGYFLVLGVALLAGGWSHGRWRLRPPLLGLMAVSLLLFTWQVRIVRSDVWRELFQATTSRLAQGRAALAWHDWAVRVASVLTTHISPILWLLALGGAVVTWRASDGTSRRWLGRCAGLFFGMSAVYVTLFRNASAIHDYASFYFTVPVSILSGAALDAACRWGERYHAGMSRAILALVCILLATLNLEGQQQTLALRHPFRLLREDQAEPTDLIPELGRAMRAWFGEDVSVICNFLPTYGPHLHYYAQHELLTSIFTAEEWADVLADPENAPLGGVIWLGDPRAATILARLPAGVRETKDIRGVPFCFWRPAEATLTNARP